MAPGRGTQIASEVAVVWGWCVVFVGVVAVLAFPLLLKESESGYCENDDHPGPCAGAVELFAPPLVVLAVGAATLLPAQAWWRGRRWGRRAAAVAFSLWALGALAGARTVVVADDELHLGALAFWVAAASVFAAIAVQAARPARSGRPRRSGRSGRPAPG